VLDQTTQNVSASAYRSKLGFAERDETALSTASTLVVQTLEEYGHEVDQFHAKRAHRVSLECDHFIVDLRHRRSPAPMRQTDGAPCRSQLDLIITPRFPERTDAELVEMLLARMLENLLGELDATTVEWLDTAIVLDRAAFLSAFAPEQPSPDQTSGQTTGQTSGQTAQELLTQDIQMPINEQEATPVTAARNPLSCAHPVLAFDSYAARHADPLPDSDSLGGIAPDASDRPRTAGRSRFAPVEETFGTLTMQCDRIIERRDRAGQGDFAAACRKVTGVFASRGSSVNTASAWVLTAILAILALPLGITAAAVNLVRGGDMRFSVQMLALMALLMFLQSSGLVHAALH